MGEPRLRLRTGTWPETFLGETRAGEGSHRGESSGPRHGWYAPTDAERDETRDGTEDDRRSGPVGRFRGSVGGRGAALGKLRRSPRLKLVQMSPHHLESWLL